MISKKYFKFFKFLERNENLKIQLTFKEIEKIIGFKLPFSAYNHSAYFSNGKSHPLSKIWLELNYKQTKLCLDKNREYIILEKALN